MNYILTPLLKKNHLLNKKVEHENQTSETFFKNCRCRNVLDKSRLTVRSIHGRLQHDTGSPSGCRMDRQMPPRPPHIRIDIRNDNSGFQAVSRARLLEKGPRVHRQRREGFNTGLRIGSRSRALHFTGNVLGPNEFKSARLLCLGFDGEGEQLLQDVYHMDQSEDTEDFRATEYV